MTRLLWIALAAIAAFATTLKAGDAVTLEIAPTLGRSTGTTSYELNPIGEVPGVGIVSIRSRLEFPLDCLMAGASVTLAQGEGDAPIWSIAVRAAGSIQDPDGSVIDQDWIGLLDNYEIEFSHTWSGAEGTMSEVELESSLRLYAQASYSLSAIAGFRYHNIEQEVHGVTGWQRPQGTNILEFGPPVVIDLDGQVGIYKITYKTPSIGMRGTILPRPGSEVEVSVAGLLVFFDDFDNHLLRGKTANADGDGFGAASSLRFTHRFRGGSRITPFIAANGVVRFLSADGTQTQRWYANDPATPLEDETGQSYSGIPYEVKSTQYSLTIEFGVSF